MGEIEFTITDVSCSEEMENCYLAYLTRESELNVLVEKGLSRKPMHIVCDNDVVVSIIKNKVVIRPVKHAPRRSILETFVRFLEREFKD